MDILDFLNTATWLIVLGVILAIICYLVTEYVEYRKRRQENRRPENPNVTTEKHEGDLTEENRGEDRNAVSFYLSIMLGLLGSFVTATLVEIGKGLLQNPLPKLEISYFAILFCASSFAFFQITKFAMERFGVRRGLNAFDKAIAICIILGIYTIIWVDIIAR